MNLIISNIIYNADDEVYNKNVLHIKIYDTIFAKKKIFSFNYSLYLFSLLFLNADDF